MDGTKTIGVMGGMGPMASDEFYRRLVKGTRAESDQDHLHIVIDSDPSVPNRTDALLHDGPCPVPALQAMARRLETAGADFLVMPCNTAHVYIGEIRAAVSIHVVDMINETASTIERSPVGLLATDGTIETGLYQRAFEARGLGAIVPEPEDQATVMDVITAIKADTDLRKQKRWITPVVERLATAGAQVAIAACTELSLLTKLVKKTDTGIPWIDALDVLVRVTLRTAGARIVGEREESE